MTKDWNTLRLVLRKSEKRNDTFTSKKTRDEIKILSLEINSWSTSKIWLIDSLFEKQKRNANSKIQSNELIKIILRTSTRIWFVCTWTRVTNMTIRSRSNICETRCCSKYKRSLCETRIIKRKISFIKIYERFI